VNKTKIDWCDMTFNPVTGCLHGCEYCYARKIANRFGNKYMPFGNDLNVLTSRVSGEKGVDPYPFGFEPTLHQYRLDEPAKIKTPQTIFVCSMADLFGEWVPDEWIQEVFRACEAAPWHRYLFLTKNAEGTAEYDQYFDMHKNWWCGISATNQGSEYGLSQMTINANRFISIEPILEPVILHNRIRVPSADWVIIGAETGNRKGKVIPEKAWIDNIAEHCFMTGVPIFMKESLRELMGADFIQQFPWKADAIVRQYTDLIDSEAITAGAILQSEGEK